MTSYVYIVLDRLGRFVSLATHESTAKAACPLGGSVERHQL